MRFKNIPPDLTMGELEGQTQGYLSFDRLWWPNSADPSLPWNRNRESCLGFQNIQSPLTFGDIEGQN